MIMATLTSSITINVGSVNAVSNNERQSQIDSKKESKVSANTQESLKQDSSQNEQKSSKESTSSTSSKATASESKQTSSSESKTSDTSQKSESKSVIQDQSRTGIMPTATINDGVTGWQDATQSTIASIVLDKATNKTLNYTFGNSDGSLTWDQGNGSSPSGVMPPRFNVFIRDNGKLVESSYKSTSGMGGSYDYSLLTRRNDALPNIRTSATSAKLSFTKYYQATDAKGQKILKMVGKFTAQGSTIPNYTVEYLLRPSLEKPSVQQELYIYSTATTPVEGGIFFAKDTSLNGNDGVPVYAQADNQGMYIADGSYKLFLNMGVDDGPTKFNAMNFHRSGDYGTSDYALNGYLPATFDGTGVEAKNLKEGTAVYTGSDSAYSAKWNWQTFQPDTVYHYRSDLGIATSGLVVPEAKETYVNHTTQDQKNHVHDTVNIKMTAHNLGYNSEWKNINISSKIPDELDIDTATIKAVLNNGDQVTIAPSAYDKTTRMLTVKLPKNLVDNEWSSVTFDATINNKASGTTIKSSMLAKTEGGTGNFDTATDDMEIPVELAPVNIEKTVLNETEKETTFKKTAIGHIKDTLDYQVKITVPKQGAIMTNSVLADDLAKKGLELVPGSVKLEYSDKTVEKPTSVKNISLKKMSPGDSVTLTYQVKVKEDVATGTVLKNTVLYVGEQANNGMTGNQDDATVTIEKPKISEVHFKYIDRKTGDPIATEVIATGNINSKVSDLKATDISTGQDPNKIRPAYIEGYTPIDFTTDTDLNTAVFADIKDVDPVIDANVVTYTFRYEKTRLAITSLPTKMNFGKFDTTQADRTFYLPAPTAQPRSGLNKNPYSIEISDFWGIENWTLSVEQAQQFHGQYTKPDSLSTQNVELDGAQLQFNNAKFTTHTEANHSISNAQDKVTAAPDFKLTPGGAPTKVIDYQRSGQYLKKDSDNTGGLAYDNPGYSIHKYQFGDERTADYSIGLHVPESTKRYKTEYTTSLKWNLTVAP